MNGLIIAGGIAAFIAVALYMREKQAMTEERPNNNGSGSAPAPIDRPIYSGRLLTSMQKHMADLIVREATRKGINPAFMIALAVTESSLEPSAIGDDGLSYGLFQLNRKFISAEPAELLDAEFNTDAALEKMGLLFRSFPGNSYGDYAEAWTLGGAGRFKKMRRNPGKLTTMQKAIDDLGLHLYLTEKP